MNPSDMIMNFKRWLKPRALDMSANFWTAMPGHNSVPTYDFNTVTLLDTSLASENSGDHIIMSYAGKVVEELFPESKFEHLKTHDWDWDIERAKKNSLKIVGGTNLISPDVEGFHNPLALPILRLPAYRHSVALLGVGMRFEPGRSQTITPFTSKLLHYVLDPRILHSVRDEQTKQQLAAVGIRNVANTACVTMWNLTPEFNKTIPVSKSENVLTTVTDYRKDPEADRFMLSMLLRKYRHVHAWIQADEDREYITELMGADSGISFIGHDLRELNEFLDEHPHIDYVGTRLHCGVHCLNHRIRSLIIIVDNRAREIHRDTGLPAIERDELRDRLESFIDDDRETRITIPLSEIRRWKQQFLKLK
ncbi:hypothetical protein GFD17_00920 [Bifidobacterium sp. SMB2]|uniref:Polysaccharide pyruvyl transferase domain-containing protein n=2 Tax=Bifidobacterium TaxID=1678 RepID=A0ABX0CA65_9BIFI|nr:hypothetical protein [Bifidobacterium sp. SMB2]NEH11475.1 hypothetical protein [Bifidobacterium saimiriisciurei]